MLKEVVRSILGAKCDVDFTTFFYITQLYHASLVLLSFALLDLAKEKEHII
jgi:hypothetical protein